jgi:arylsulfatase A-like enzyme
MVEIRFKNKKEPGVNNLNGVLIIKLVKKTAPAIIGVLLFLNIGIFIDTGNKSESPNIILIVVDCLRPDHLSCYGYTRNTSPAIDELAGKGVFFRNAYSNAPWTKPSVASIFTSVYPNEHSAISLNDVLPEGVLTIAEFLKNSGFHTCFFNGGNYSIGREFNFDQGFDYYSLKPFNQNKTTGLTDNFISHINSIYPKKFFAYIHYMDTHVPYNKNDYNTLFDPKANTYLEPGINYISNWHIRIMTHNNRLTEEDRDYLISLYDGQIRLVDENIKKIITALKVRKDFDNTVIILTSDHGEEFWEHNNYEHGHTLYNELLHVPLIIYGNRLKHFEVKKQASLIDIFPVIMEMLNIEYKNSFIRGTGLKRIFNRNADQPEDPLFFTGTLYGDEKYSMLKGDKKIIINTSNTKKKEKLYGYSNKDNLEIYDLTRDPLEKQNPKDSDNQTVSLLKKDLKKFIDLKPQHRNAEVVINDELKEKLMSLGYVQ